MALLPDVDYGPGHVLLPKVGAPSFPLQKAFGQGERLFSRKFDLRLTPEGRFVDQALVNGAYSARLRSEAAPLWERFRDSWAQLGGRTRGFGAFVLGSLYYLPTRDPNLPALGFAELTGGGAGVFRNVEVSQLLWGLVFLSLAFAAVVFLGRAIKIGYRRKKREERAARVMKSPIRTAESHRAAEKASQAAVKARSLNYAAAAACFGGALLAGNFVSHVATYLLFSIALLRLAYKGIGSALTDVAGDVQIYVTRNENSERFEAREQVLSKTIDSLWEVLRSDRYDDVIVAGHSLGSVIGVEAIRRMYANLAVRPENDPDWLAFRKIRAYVTFGSPLEKTRLYFQRDDYKSRYAEFSQEIDLRIFRKTDPGRSCIRWVNYWMFDDIVSDPLTTYPVDAEKQLGYRAPEGGRPKLKFWPHSDYWHEPLFVRELAQLVLEKLPSLPAGPNPVVPAPVAPMAAADRGIGGPNAAASLSAGLVGGLALGAGIAAYLAARERRTPFGGKLVSYLRRKLGF